MAEAPQCHSIYHSLGGGRNHFPKEMHWHYILKASVPWTLCQSCARETVFHLPFDTVLLPHLVICIHTLIWFFL